MTYPGAGTQPVLSRETHGTPGVKPLLLLLSLLAFFIAAGLVFIPYVGIQNDEALFSAPLYSPLPPQFTIRAFHQNVPLMLMSYVGALKTWIYALVFSLWKPGLYSLRLPVLLAGATTIWFFYRLLERSVGMAAALAGAALLAVDVSFLLTTTFDWGPVALQHLLLIGGMVLVLGAYQDQSRAKLACGFFLFGLGIWDKALFVWMFSGVAVACAAVFPRELRRMLNWRNVAVAVSAFLAGALPLVVYNVRDPLATFNGNAVFSAEGIAGKARLVKSTMEGSSLLGYIAHDEWGVRPHPPEAALERASVAVRNLAGEHRSGLLFWALLVALALAAWSANRRAVLFAVIVIAVAWPQMAFTRNAGGGAHHAVLLWPFPHMIVAAAFAGASGRAGRYGGAALTAAIAVVCGSNLLVLNQHLSQLVQYGAAGVWTDAIYPLSDELGSMAKRSIVLADWGELDLLTMLHQGRLHLIVGSAPLMGPQISPAELREIGQLLALPSTVFVCHTKPYEVFPGVADRLMEGAAQLGYYEHVLDTVRDSNSRPVFRIIEFRKRAP